MKNGSLIGSCDREKGNDHRDKIFGPRIHFFIVFFIFLQTFFCQGQFFLQIFFAAQFFFFFSRGNKQILVSRGRVQYCFVSRRLSFVVPRDNFCPKGWPFWVFLVNEKRSLSEPEKLKRAVPKDKNSPKGQQSSTWGTKKQYCTLPRDTKICLFPRDEKKEKFEQQKQIWKKIGLGRKKPAKIWKRQWKSGFVVRKVYLRGRFLFHRHNFLLLSFIWF